MKMQIDEDVTLQSGGGGGGGGRGGGGWEPSGHTKHFPQRTATVILKREKAVADRDEAAWGRRGRDREMKSARARYIYIM